MNRIYMPTRYSGLIELAAWAGGLIYLWLIDPSSPAFSFCPLKVAGFAHCPGCGLGTSIAYLFEGQIADSIHAHPLGAFAAVILIARIITLTKPILSVIITHSKGYTHA